MSKAWRRFCDRPSDTVAVGGGSPISETAVLESARRTSSRSDVGVGCGHPMTVMGMTEMEHTRICLTSASWRPNSRVHRARTLGAKGPGSSEGAYNDAEATNALELPGSNPTGSKSRRR